MYLWALSYTPCLLVWVKATRELGPASGQFWDALAMETKAAWNPRVNVYIDTPSISRIPVTVSQSVFGLEQ